MEWEVCVCEFDGKKCKLSRRESRSGYGGERSWWGDGRMWKIVHKRVREDDLYMLQFRLRTYTCVLMQKVNCS